jgi:hypothetical protein
MQLSTAKILYVRNKGTTLMKTNQVTSVNNETKLCCKVRLNSQISRKHKLYFCVFFLCPFTLVQSTGLSARILV